MAVALTRAQARRLALSAQGFGRPRPARVTMRHLQGVVDAVAQFQIDSVNVAVRAHLVPLFARLGPYDPALLERASGRAPRRLFEYWGHAASLLDVRLEPALRLRMARHRADEWGQVQRILADKPRLREQIMDDLARSGPLTARAIENTEERRKDNWGWNWSEAKYVLEYLFACGEVAVGSRNKSFERLYDLRTRVLPAAQLDTPDPSEEESYDQLVARAARALGVADLAAIADYFYLRKAPTAAALARLSAAGRVREVSVAGAPGTHWLWTEATVPRRVVGQALVSPFDSLVFQRDRLLALFDVDYRIEIYVPAAKRRYGYYVYLFVLDDQIVARVDLKAERATARLVVQSAWLEEHAPSADEVATRLAAELRSMAAWLGLTALEVRPRGTLAARLAERSGA